MHKHTGRYTSEEAGVLHPSILTRKTAILVICFRAFWFFLVILLFASTPLFSYKQQQQVVRCWLVQAGACNHQSINYGAQVLFFSARPSFPVLFFIPRATTGLLCSPQSQVFYCLPKTHCRGRRENQQNLPARFQ